MKRILYALLLCLVVLNVQAERVRIQETAKDGHVWYLIKENGKEGVEDLEGRMVLPAKFDYVSYRDSHYIGKFEGTSGCYTLDGTCVVPHSAGYSSISVFKGDKDIYWYMVSNKFLGPKGAWYNGKEVVPVKYDIVMMDCNSESEPLKPIFLGIIEDKNFKWDAIGVYDYTGKMLVDDKKSYDAVILQGEDTDHEDAYFIVKIGECWGIVDIDGKEILEPVFDDYADYNSQLGFIGYMKDGNTHFTNIFIVNGKKKYIDHWDRSLERIVARKNSGSISESKHSHHQPAGSHVSKDGSHTHIHNDGFSHTDEQGNMYAEYKCGACAGSGKCGLCNGTGIFGSMGHCPVCAGSGRCGMCFGSGKTVITGNVNSNAGYVNGQAVIIDNNSSGGSGSSSTNPVKAENDYHQFKKESDQKLNEENYRRNYASQEKTVEMWYKSCTTGGYRTQSNGTQKGGMDASTGSLSANSQLLSKFRIAQNELRQIRVKAARNGVNISPSHWETATVSVY